MILSLIVFLLTIIVLSLPYSLEIAYHRHQQDDDLKLLFWIGPIPFQIRLSVIRWFGDRFQTQAQVGNSLGDVDVSAQFSVTDLLKLLDSPMLKYFQLIFGRLYSFVREIAKLEMRVKFSTGESGLTALSAGLIWGVIGTTLGLMNTTCVFSQRPIVQITPSYGPPLLKLQLRCIFRIRLGHIIFEGIKNKYRLLIRRIFGQRRVHI